MSYITNYFNRRVVELVEQGSIGLVPTDTIYGLSCAALNEQAVNKIHKMKIRSENKPLIVLVSNTNMLNLLSISPNYLSLVSKHWPGPLSVIFDAPAAPSWLRLNGRTLAVRIPAKQDLLEFINKTGPIVSTSANLQGHKPAASAGEAQKLFAGKLDFYIDQGRLDGQPSTVVKLEGDKLSLIRQGSLKIDDI